MCGWKSDGKSEPVTSEEPRHANTSFFEILLARGRKRGKGTRLARTNGGHIDTHQTRKPPGFPHFLTHVVCQPDWLLQGERMGEGENRMIDQLIDLELN